MKFNNIYFQHAGWYQVKRSRLLEKLKLPVLFFIFSLGWILWFSTSLAAQPFSQPQRIDIKVFSGNDCYPDNLVAADLNGDGLIDIAATGFCRRFAVLFADASQPLHAGRFLSPKEVRLPDSAIGMAVIPSKTKALPFLVFSNCANPDSIPRQPRLQVVSMETFKVVQDFPSGGKAPDDIAVADFNSDGLLDLLVGHWKGGTLSLLLGKEGGGFQVPANPSPQRISIGTEHWKIIPADFNNDGKLDVAFVVWTSSSDVKGRKGAVVVLLGDGKGGFDLSTMKSYPVDPETRSLAVADLDGDGKLDIAAANPGSGTKEDGSVLLLFGDGKGGFQPKTLTASDLGGGLLGPQGIVAADFDGDGRPDLALASRPLREEGHLYVLHNKGEGRFSLADGQALPLGPGSRVSQLGFRPIIAADLNGDGMPDLAVTNQELKTVSIFFNTTHTPMKSAMP